MNMNVWFWMKHAMKHYAWCSSLNERKNIYRVNETLYVGLNLVRSNNDVNSVKRYALQFCRYRCWTRPQNCSLPRQDVSEKLCISSQQNPPEATCTSKQHRFWNAWFHFLSSITPTYSEDNFTQLTKTRYASRGFRHTGCMKDDLMSFLFLRLSACAHVRLKNILGARFRMSNGLRVLDDINPRGHHLHGSVPSLSDETLTSALSSPYYQHQWEVIYQQ